MSSPGNSLRTLSRYYNLNRKDPVKPRIFNCGPGVLSIFTRSSPNTAGANEDSVGVIPIDNDNVVLMVADGLGGHINGKDASMLVLDEVRKAVNRARRQGGVIREAIFKGIERANRSLMKKLPGAASTIAMVEIQGQSFSTYHAGDSEILVTDKSGDIRYQSIVHSPVGYAVEAGILDENQAIMHNERHLVSNVVGDPDMHISMTANVELNDDETMLLASDGLFDNLQKNEITNIIKQGELLDCSNELYKKANTRMYETDSSKPSKFDDLSFILFRLHAHA